MSYGVHSIQIHKKLRLDKRAGSDNWYARLTLPNGKRLVKTTKTEDRESAKEVALWPCQGLVPVSFEQCLL